MGAGAGAQKGLEVILTDASQGEINGFMTELPESTRHKMAEALAESSPKASSPPPPQLLLRAISGEKHVALPGVDDVKGDAQGLIPPDMPDLVRGYTKMDRKEDLVAELVANAMKSRGWDGVDVSTIKVKDTSGYGGSKTYKVTADGMTPAAVALHSRSEEVADDELSDPRMEAASTLLSKYKLVPSRIVYGGDWFIDEWEGTGNPDFNSEEVAKQVGEFLAKFHEVPTEWYNSWRQKLVDRFAQNFPDAQKSGNGLDQVPHGSHVWWYTCRREWLDKMEPGKRAIYFNTDLFAPRSAVGQRIVTTHGDLHPGNMIVCGSGVKAIDLEFTTANWAIYDIGYTSNCFPTNDLKRTFFESYLVASGFPAEAHDVDALFIDAKINSHTYHFSPFSCWKFDPQELAVYKLAYDRVRADPQPYLQSGQPLKDWMLTIPEVKAAKAEADTAKYDTAWSKLAPLTVAEQKEGPLATLGWHGSEALSCELSQFSCAGWVYLHPHQKYHSQQNAEAMCIASTGYHFCHCRTTGRFGNMWFGWCERKKFDFNLHGQVKHSETGADDDLEFLDSQWHHVAVVYSAAEKQHIVYVDGTHRRTVSYYSARPLRIPDVLAAGGSPSLRIPMEPYKDRSAGKKLLVVKVDGHATDEYNGVYVQVEDASCHSLHCDMPFFQSKTGKYLKKYNAEACGGPDWSFDDRRPVDGNDWCRGGWYFANKGEELALGTFDWADAGQGGVTVSWAELEAEKVGDDDAEMSAKPPDGLEHGHVCFQARYDFPEGQLSGVSLFSRCLAADEVAQMYANEVKEARPAPPAPPEVVLEKVPLDKVLTWNEHVEKAEELGAQMPTKEDLVLGKAKGDGDCWVPVIRQDGMDDWVQLGEKHHPIYISHHDAYHVASWGRNNNGSEWRPDFFYVKR